MQKLLSPYLNFSPAVKTALNEGLPLVALESTIIAHGMPYPQNVETAMKVEQIIKATGAVPATIAVMNGQLKVGLTEEEITRLGKAGPAVVKCSRRDLPFIVQQKRTGATTVAATMIIAELAGIQVFATGGIGGVHRGAQLSMDISADLQELARTSVAVVCAGAKAILDLELTLEYLETHGVPVIGFRTKNFPAFYTRKSGFAVDYEFQDITELAMALDIKWATGLKGGVVVANPIPEEYAMDKQQIDVVIAQALAEAERDEIRGKAITPFLLAKIGALTKGASLDANIQLVYHNAMVAAELAVALEQL